MIRTLIIACCLLTSVCIAQQDIYKKVSTFIKQGHPTLVVQSKLMVINFVNANSAEGKSVYSSLEKTAKVYGNAKLKGGKSGVICVTVVDDTQTEIALNKEGFKEFYIINKSVLENTDIVGLENITYNSSGEVVFKNLEQGKIYEAINQLITR
jgi:hypothetical protein